MDDLWVVAQAVALFFGVGGMGAVIALILVRVTNYPKAQKPQERNDK